MMISLFNKDVALQTILYILSKLGGQSGKYSIAFLLV